MKMVFKARHIALALILLAPTASTGPLAQATPNHVLQTIDTLMNELALLHEANLSKPPQTKATVPPNRRPRHVYQKAREIFLKADSARWLNGLKQLELPPPPTREITPGDVKVLVQKTLESVRDLKPVFSVTQKAAEASLPSGKTPTNVFKGLIRAGASIDALGIPAVVPNDVYRLALTATDSLEKVLTKRGIRVEAQVRDAGRSTGKKPTQVYKQGIELLAALKAATDSSANLKVPGGIVIPAMPDDAITPGRVLDLTGNILADVGAMKAVLGIAQPTALAPIQAGKTPSDVYDALNRATQMALALSGPGATPKRPEPNQGPAQEVSQ